MFFEFMTNAPDRERFSIPSSITPFKSWLFLVLKILGRHAFLTFHIIRVVHIYLPVIDPHFRFCPLKDQTKLKDPQC